jgi:hypothetical protein
LIIPLTIGFANFAALEASEFLEHDLRLLSPMFAQARTPPPHQLMPANILFLYAGLNDDGLIRGLNQVGVRQIVQASGAQLLIVAMANSTTAYKNATTLPGPKSANLVLTLDRHGDDFAIFFHDLFAKMGEGLDMLAAWVELAPQGPVPHQNLPVTVLIPEAGGLTFPKAV